MTTHQLKAFFKRMSFSPLMESAEISQYTKDGYIFSFEVLENEIQFVISKTPKDKALYSEVLKDNTVFKGTLRNKKQLKTILECVGFYDNHALFQEVKDSLREQNLHFAETVGFQGKVKELFFYNNDLRIHVYKFHTSSDIGFNLHTYGSEDGVATLQFLQSGRISSIGEFLNILKLELRIKGVL